MDPVDEEWWSKWQWHSVILGVCHFLEIGTCLSSACSGGWHREKGCSGWMWETHHKAGVALMLTEEVRRQAENFPKAVQLARDWSGTVPAWLLHSHNPTPPTEPESAENTEGPDTKSSEIPLWEERQCWNFWENDHQCSGADHSELILWMGETADSRNRLSKEYNKRSWTSWSRYGLTCLSLWVRGGWPSAPPDADPSDTPPQVHTLSLFLLIFQTHTNKPGLFHPEECLLTTTDPFLIVIGSLNYRHTHVSGKSSPQST